MKEKDLLKLWFHKYDENCYAINWDIWDLDFYSDIMRIRMWSMLEDVRDLEHLKKIVDKWNDLWTTIVYGE